MAHCRESTTHCGSGDCSYSGKTSVHDRRNESSGQDHCGCDCVSCEYAGESCKGIDTSCSCSCDPCVESKVASKGERC
jgi:hypothetical protein